LKTRYPIPVSRIDNRMLPTITEAAAKKRSPWESVASGRGWASAGLWCAKGIFVRDADVMALRPHF